MKNPSTFQPWVELIATLDNRGKPLVAEVHPTGGSVRHCQAIRIEGKWLSGSDGLPTFFRNAETVDRFLQMIGVQSKEESGEPISLDDACIHGHQCFCLQGSGLSPCPTLLASNRSRATCFSSTAA
jgi:hypothetical protein